MQDERITPGTCLCGCGKPVTKRLYWHKHAARGPGFDPYADGQGLCRCGCGERAPLAQQTVHALGHVEGLPQRFVRGHANRLTTPAYEVDANGCWIWLRSKNNSGYGHGVFGGKLVVAHKGMYEAKHGPVPEGLVLHHTCEVRACCNPDHVIPVSPLENIRKGKRVVLTLEKAREIKRSSETTYRVAKRLGVSYSAAYMVRAGNSWRDA